MNPFYRRLLTFGQLLQHLSQINKTDYQAFIEVEHPAHPVFRDKAQVKPRLLFVKRCSKRDRHQIIDLFEKCFSNSHGLTL